MSAIRTRLVTTEAAWDALAPAWDALLRIVEGHTVFQTHAFLRCWWRHLGSGMTPWIVVATRGERLVGIAPLQLARRRIWGRTYRVLELMGMPNELDRPTLPVEPGDTEALDALLDAVAERPGEWDLMQLDELEADSWIIPCFEAWASRHALWCRSRHFHACPYLEKNGATWEDYVRGKSARFTKRLRQARQKLASTGPVTYDVYPGGGDAATMVDTFFEVEQRSWKANRGLAAGTDPAYRTFCLDLLTATSSPHTGHAIVQRVAGRPTAATVGLSLDGIYYSLQIAHDQAFDGYSPGTLLEAFEMEWFFGNRVLRRYEFLGGEVFNKRRWTETAVSTNQVFIRRPGLHIALKDLSRFHISPALERLRRRLNRSAS